MRLAAAPLHCRDGARADSRNVALQGHGGLGSGLPLATAFTVPAPPDCRDGHCQYPEILAPRGRHRMKIDGRLAVSLMMLAVFLFFVGQALAFKPQARDMPLLVGIPGILLCLLQIGLELKKQGRAAVETILLSAEERPAAVWLLVFLAGIIA